MLNLERSKHFIGNVSLKSLKCQGLNYNIEAQRSPHRFAAYNDDYQYSSLEGASVFVDGLYWPFPVKVLSLLIQ